MTILVMRISAETADLKVDRRCRLLPTKFLGI